MADAWKADFPSADSNVVATPCEIGNMITFGDMSDESFDLKIANYISHLSMHAGGEAALHGVLDRAFECLNAPTREVDCPATGDCKPESRWCNLAGMCLCTARGKQLRMFRESCYLVGTKPLAPAHSDERDELKTGAWFLFLQPGKVVDDRFVAVPCDGSVGRSEVFLHMGYHAISPWRPTFHACTRTEALVGEPPSGASRVYIKASTAI